MSYTFLLLQKNRSQNIYLMTTTKKIYCIIKVTDRTTILQIIIWFCKWYHDLMFFNSLYKIVVSIYTKLSRCMKTYSIMLYQIPKKKHEYVYIENWYYEKAYHELITPNSILLYQIQKLESYKVCMAYF